MNLPRLNRDGALYLVAFISCIPIANWMIGNVGTKCVPNGPCLVPVWPGIMAPSGVLMIGFALVLRDLVQQRLGRSWAIAAIMIGALVSGLVAPPTLVVASMVAFTVSEFADFAVYTPLQEKRFFFAVIASSFAGAVADSFLFLWLAFGSLEFLSGQIMGKIWAVIAAFPAIFIIRRRLQFTNMASHQ
jgi:uncharacterized PurR-regulated membrane protein YhhQ (DUF165 family)